MLAARRRLAVILGAFDLASALFALWVTIPAPLNGVAFDATHHRLGGISVHLDAGNGRHTQTHTDAQGRFSLWTPRWPVAWTLTLTGPGFLPAHTTGGVAVVHRLPALGGQVVDESGAPVPDALVAIGGDGGPVGLTAANPAGYFRLTGLPVGTQAITSAADGHDAFLGSLRLKPDDNLFQALVLPRQLATLAITSDPPGQPVLVDGAARPDCPLTPCQVAIPVGGHKVHVESDLYVPWEQAYSLVKGDQVAVAAKLTRKTGTLAVVAPASGELKVDGQDVRSGTWSAAVPTGAHSAAFRSATTWPALGSAQVDWNQGATITLAPTPIAPGDTAGFLNGLRAYLAAAGGQYGVYLEELGSGRSLGVGQDDLMEAASVIKVPLALYLLSQADHGALKLDDKVTLEEQDFMGGTGTLDGTASPGDQYSYGDLLALLIQQSDNTAWQALDRVLGAGKVDAYAASAGAPDCRQDSDSCTAHEAGLLLGALARGKLLSADSTHRLLGLLESTAFNDRINYYLGGVTVAHKVGMDGGVMNDAGIVYLQGDPFVIAVFTATPDADTGVQAIRDISRAAARLYAH